MTIEHIIHERFDRIERQFDLVDERFEAIEKRFIYLEDKWDKRMETFDKLAAEIAESREDRVLGNEQRIRMDDTLQNHEKRIRSLEAKAS